jgi:hypothetical protein
MPPTSLHSDRSIADDRRTSLILFGPTFIRKTFDGYFEFYPGALHSIWPTADSERVES